MLLMWHKRAGLGGALGYHGDCDTCTGEVKHAASLKAVRCVGSDRAAIQVKKMLQRSR